MTNKLVVDLRGRLIETLDDIWDAVSEPCGLPEWFGRNLDAWSDTIETRVPGEGPARASWCGTPTRWPRACGGGRPAAVPGPDRPASAARSGPTSHQ
ncbi:hypothetical protein DD630_33160 [Streptomyces sp. BSE7F]|nr:hypothetical protein DD630_33160 [Streptomyces sp. BSE7F]